MPRKKKTTDESADIANIDAPELLPAPVSDEVIEKTVAELHSAYREGVLGTAIRMGEIIVNNIYEGDLDAWRSRGVKDTSFRKLADRLKGENGDSDLSASYLSRACGIYELDKRVGVAARQHLTATHVRVVLGLPDKKQEQLLKRADEQRWSTRKLEEEVRNHRSSDGRGRKPLPVFQKALSKLLRAIEEAASEPVPEDIFTAYGKYGPDDAKQLLHDVDLELGKLTALREQIEARIRDAEAAQVAKEE